jgi:hypothetical protein
MRKPFLHRVIALFMAIYLPAALVGVPLHKHYCQGQLADIKVFVETESCHDNSEETVGCCGAERSSCHSNQDEEHNALEACGADSCCDDQLELLRADVNIITQNTSELDADLAEIINMIHAGVLTHKAVQQFPSFINHSDLPGPFLNGQDRLLHFGQFLC